MLTGSKLELNWTAWNQSSFGRSECDEKSGKEEEKYQHDDDDDDGKLDFQEEKWIESLVPAIVLITPKGKLFSDCLLDDANRSMLLEWEK